MAANDILQVSFYGPFFFDFSKAKEGKVLIYAPRCPGHRAGVHSAKVEFPILGRYKFGHNAAYKLHLEGFSPPKKAEFFGAERVEVAKPKKGGKLKASFHIQVPLPPYVYGLNPSPRVEVVRGNKEPSGIDKNYATGLRFYYPVDLSKQVQFERPAGQVPVNFTFEEFPGTNMVAHSDIVIRYSSGTADDSEHEDAKECFVRIAEVAGCDGWWIHYQSTPVSTHVRAGVDCAAPIMVIT